MQLSWVRRNEPDWQIILKIFVEHGIKWNTSWRVGPIDVVLPSGRDKKAQKKEQSDLHFFLLDFSETTVQYIKLNGV